MVDLINATRGSHEFYLHRQGPRGAHSHGMRTQQNRRGLPAKEGKAPKSTHNVVIPITNQKSCLEEDVLIPSPSVGIIQDSKYDEDP